MIDVTKFSSIRVISLHLSDMTIQFILFPSLLPCPPSGNLQLRLGFGHFSYWLVKKVCSLRPISRCSMVLLACVEVLEFLFSDFDWF